MSSARKRALAAEKSAKKTWRSRETADRQVTKDVWCVVLCGVMHTLISKTLVCDVTKHIYVGDIISSVDSFVDVDLEDFDQTVHCFILLCIACWKTFFWNVICSLI